MYKEWQLIFKMGGVGRVMRRWRLSKELLIFVVIIFTTILQNYTENCVTGALGD